MKKYLIIAIGLTICKFAFAQTSIYDIQYTTNAGDGTYPSSYNGQIVTTGGIVTATNYLTGQYFISSPQGGAWNGLFVYSNSYSPNIGDNILITGLILEYQGYTEIKDLTYFSVISTGNALPETTNISTGEVTSEAYEGVLVEVNSCNVSNVYDTGGSWKVDDSSGACDISTGIFNLKEYGFPMIVNYPFNQIVGVIGVNSGNKKLHPRSIDDIKSGDNALIISTDNKSVYDNSSIEIPVKISILNQSEAISTYSLKIQYNEAIFEYTGFSKANTISESGSITDVSTAGNITLNFSGSIACDNVDILVKLYFTPTLSGNADLQFNETTINGSPVPYFSIGNLEYISTECDIPIGDTITIVQRPLLNIPSIVVPGQELNITCFAPQTTTNWNAELFFSNVTVPLNITQSTYDTNLERWTLKTTIPNVDLYELYNLRVTASDGILDNVTNAVKVIDQYKDNYYFVHITDTHLLGHTFYGETGYETDESELADLYEVIKDINLIRPEFVLLTGDLINEGELEDFECLRNHTLTVEMLKNFEVPVYIVPGNHDLGGWDATPPPQGTSRREWWRFFGWRQPQIPPVLQEYYTHDYSFDYGNVHYTGLEAYDNYDSYMYGVYGATSFIPSQITWLQNDLEAAGSKKKVLFYHYDFKDELDLSALGVDMALWGHIHVDAGSISTYPYNLATASACDGNRAFRVIRVNGSTLQPENTIHTHTSGVDMLTSTFNMVNNGTLDSVSVTISNSYGQTFSNGLVKFEMPLSTHGYSVYYGTLEQVLNFDSYAVCYVNVSIPAQGEITVSISKNTEEVTTKSIYDIQYTPNAGNGTYPSVFSGQTVTTGGIVTAINYMGGRFFISSSLGGAWNGLLVYDNTYSPALGDSILISGKILEYNGYTEITEITSFEVKSTGNPLPETAKITTANITAEAYEGVLVEVNNCNATGNYDSFGNFSVNDGSSLGHIRTGIFSLKNVEFPVIQNYPFSYIRGVVAYHYGITSVHPRYIHDFQSPANAFIVITNDMSINNDPSNFELPVSIANLNQAEVISNYALKIQYNSAAFQYLGFNETATISETGTITDFSTEGSVDLRFTGTATCNTVSTLIKLLLKPVASGTANFQLSETTINETPLNYSVIGNLVFTSTANIDDVTNDKLVKCYPNPFSVDTKISFLLTEEAEVSISIYNIAGQLVKTLLNEKLTPGNHSAKWNGLDDSGTKVENDVYLYRYNVNGKAVTSGQIVLLR